MENKIKALHVTGFWSGNYYVRSFLPVYAINMLHELGWTVSNNYIEGVPHNGQELVAKMHAADVVQFQRPNYESTYQLMQAAKQLNKIVIFDDDDTFKLGDGIVPQDEKEEQLAKKINERRIKALKLAHGATCTTEFLAKELREHNNNVMVTPNCVDPDRFDDNTPNTSDKPRILVLGSVISNDDWHIARKAILEHADKATFVLLGVPDIDRYQSYKKDMEFWSKLPNVEMHPFKVFGAYFDAIQELGVDFAIAPRADNYFNRCKSNLKFLEVSQFGIPFIGQGFSDGLSPYQANPEDQKHLVLVDYHEEAWVDALRIALNNLDYMKELGKKAQNYVKEEYSIYKHADKWLTFYQSLI